MRRGVCVCLFECIRAGGVCVGHGRGGGLGVEGSVSTSSTSQKEMT